MSFPLWTPGQPPVLSAGGWNAAMAAADAHARNARGFRGFDSEFGEHGRAVVRVLNNSGAQRTRSEVLGLGDPLVTPSTDEARFFDDFAFEGVEPDLATHRRKFCVLLDAPSEDVIGRGVVAGLVRVQVNIVSTVHQYVTIKDADYSQLESYWWGGGKILWQESGTGTKWCVVELGDFFHPIYRGVTSTTHNKGNSETVNHYSGTGSGASSSGATIASVYNPFANVASGKRVDVAWINDGPELIAAEC